MNAAAVAGQSATQTREFLAFYREHFAFAWRTLLRLGVQSRDCEDAAQEVFVTAHRRWETLVVAHSRRGWLFGIIRRVASRDRRRQERHERRVAALRQVTSPQLELDEQVARREAWRQLAEFLDELDDDKREAFVLGELEELGRDELGRTLGINANTAYSRLQAARRHFFVHFADRDDETCARLLAHGAQHGVPDPCDRERTLAVVAPLLVPSWLDTVCARLLATAWQTWAGVTVLAAVTTGVAVHAHDSNEGSQAEATPAPVQAVTRARGGEAESVTAALPPRAPAMPPVRTPPSTALPRAARRHAVADEVRLPAATHEPDPATTAATTSDGLDLLVAARRATVAGQHERAQRLLDEHRTRFGAAAALADVRDEIDLELQAAVIATAGAGDSPEHRDTQR